MSRTLPRTLYEFLAQVTFLDLEPGRPYLEKIMNKIVCPVCGQSDQTCYVYEAIQSGTSITETEGVSLAMVESREVTLHHFTSTQRSLLAEQLSLPNPPAYAGTWLPVMFFVWLIAAEIHFINLWGNDVEWNLFNLIIVPAMILVPAGGVSVLGCLLSYGLLRLFSISDRRRWKEKAQHALTSGYCYRDNMAFDDEWAYDPTHYIQYVFNN